MDRLLVTDLSVWVEEKKVVDRCNLALPAGRIHVLMGPNGSGKSSLAHAIIGYPRYEIKQGNISFDDIDITKLMCDARARLGLFLTLQNPPAIGGLGVCNFLHEAYRALKNNAMPMPAFQELALQALRLVDMPETFLQRQVHEGFSGGEKKRFELLQAVLFAPRLIIFDEIDSGLDVDAFKIVLRVISYIKQQNPDTSMLFITHSHHLAKAINPDAVHLMRAGKLIHTFQGISMLDTLEKHGYAFFEHQSELL